MVLLIARDQQETALQHTERIKRLCNRRGPEECKVLARAATMPGVPIPIKPSSLADRFWSLMVELGWAEYSQRVKTGASGYTHYTVTRVGTRTIPRLMEREAAPMRA